MIPDPKTETTEGADQRISELRRRLSIGVRSFDRDDVVYLLDALSRPQATPDPRIAEIRERERKATKGPWCFRVSSPVRGRKRKGTSVEPLVHDGSLMIGAVAPGHQIRANPQGGSYPSSDGEFIAHARQDIPYLLDSLSALQQRVEQVTEQLSVAREMKSAYLDRAEAAEAVIAVLRKIEADLLAAGQQEFEMPRSPNWWTPDRMKAMRYGKSSALVSASLMVKHALASLASSPVSRPAETEKGKP